jgi:carboxyl-terminal processing protease
VPNRRAVLAFGISSIAAASAATARAAPLSASQAEDLAGPDTFDEVWETVRDRFFDPHLSGLDWPAVRAHYRPLLLPAPTADARAALINAMLAQLHASHTEYFLPDQTAYYQIADIFLDPRSPDLRRFFPDGEITYPGIAVLTQPDAQGRTFAVGVIDGGPAARAGLLAGDEIIAVDGAPFREVDSFRGKVGRSVTLTTRRVASGPLLELGVVPETLHPDEMFRQGLEASARIIRGPGGARIAYAHVWSYAGYIYQRTLERLIGQGVLRDADALVWDLRDGWGGAVPEYLDPFDPRGPVLEMIGRNGTTHLQNVKWRRPVAMLINGRTRSGKEILAYGFKKYRFGELIGAPTMKAVLAATAFMMQDGSLLMLAVDDVRVDGERLEGVGVTPTIEVPFQLAYSAGADPQLARAVEVLSGSIAR